VGIKPTVGLLSRSGIIPISSTQDTAGPLARTVKDAAILLGALTGADTNDAVTANSAGKAQTDYTQFLKADSLKGKRIGIDRKRRSINQQLNTLLDNAIAVLQQQGATIIDIDYLGKIFPLGKYENEILQTEFKDGVNKYLAGSTTKIKTLSDVIAFNKANEDKAMPYFKQEQLENCDKKTGLQSPGYIDALNKGRDGVRKIIDTVLLNNKLDAIAGITMGPSCSIDMLYGDRWGDDFLTQPAAMSGYPHITVPCGMANRLPVGFSFFSGPYTEPQLIAMAYAYEQVVKKRVVPQFIKSYLD
jgi:amidase